MTDEELIEIEAKRKKDQKMHMLHFRVERRIAKQFRIHCAQRAFTMQMVLESLLQTYLINEEKND